MAGATLTPPEAGSQSITPGDNLLVENNAPPVQPLQENSQPEPSLEPVIVNEDTGPKIKLNEIVPGREGDFKPKETLKKNYSNLLEDIYINLTIFEQSNSSMSQMQKDFMLAYKESGRNLLDTAKGWELAHLMIEQEIFLRTAAFGKQVELDLAGLQSDPIKYKDKLREDIGYFAGIGAKLEDRKEFAQKIGRWIDRFGNDPKDIFKSPEVLLKDMGIDISQMSLEYRAYIDQIAPQQAMRLNTKFLLDAAKAQMAFYQALGYQDTDITSLTPWGRLQLELNVGGLTASEITQGIDTEYAKVRLLKLKQGTPNYGLLAVSRGERTAQFFKAQEETIQHFLGLKLKEISQAQLSTEKGKESASVLRTRAEKIQNPEEKEEIIKKIKDDIETVGKDLTDSQTELGEVTKKQQDQVEEVAIATAKMPMQTNLRTNYEADLKITTKRAKDLVTFRKQIETDFKNAIASANLNIRATLEISRNQQLIEIDQNIRLEEQEVTEIKGKIVAITVELNRVVELTASQTTLAARKTELETQVKKLERKKKQLEKKRDDPIDETAKRTAEQIIMAADVCEKEKDRIMETTFDERSTIAQNLRIPEMTDTSIVTRHGKDIPIGYDLMLKHIFRYDLSTTDKNAQRAFENAMQLLPQDALTELFVRNFGLSSTTTDITDAFNQIRQMGLTQLQFNHIYINVLLNIEDRALHL